MICSFMKELSNITTKGEKVKGFTAKKMMWDKILIRNKSNSCQYVKQTRLENRQKIDRINKTHGM